MDFPPRLTASSHYVSDRNAPGSMAIDYNDLGSNLCKLQVEISNRKLSTQEFSAIHHALYAASVAKPGQRPHEVRRIDLLSFIAYFRAIAPTVVC